MRKSMKGALGLGLLGGLTFRRGACSRRGPRSAPKGVEWESAPFPFPAGAAAGFDDTYAIGRGLRAARRAVGGPSRTTTAVARSRIP